MKLEGFQRKLHLVRYATKSLNKRMYIYPDATVVTLVKDGKYPVREIGKVVSVVGDLVTMILESGDMAGQLFTQEITKIDALTETEWEQTAERVSLAISSVETNVISREKAYKNFLNAISNFYLVPSGRILTGAGDDSEVTLFNCYVIGVEKAPWALDKGRDSRQAIAYHQARLEEIMARGGGVGTNLDVFRPRYSPLSKTKGQSAGAVYIGNRFSQSVDFVNQGNRRGAEMLALSDWHGDVFYTNDITHPDYNEDFIGAKRKKGFMEGNNSSVLISDAFMEAVEKDLTWNLRHPDTSFEMYDEEWDGDIQKWEEKGYPVTLIRTIRARDMWDKLQQCNHSSAEPGVLFIDRFNQNHNGWYLGKISCTNPCGEQGILPNSTCNLGSINFGRMVRVVGEDALGNIYEIDWSLLDSTIRTGVRFLDNVIDASFYFDQEMEEWQKGERRIGLGGLGLADLFIALRVPYGSPESLVIEEELLKYLRDTSYMASVELAYEKGSFPFFDCKKFLQSGFVKRLPHHIKACIKLYGIRNLTLNTFAPTGTTGTLTPSLLTSEGSVSTGIEPHFAMQYNRKSRIGDTVQYAGVAKAFMEAHPEVTKLPDYFVGAMDLKPSQHIAVQAVAQKYIDSAISKTVNAPTNYSVKQTTEIYLELFRKGCKGGTIYRDGSRDEQILSISNDNNVTVENEVPEVAPVRRGKYDNWTCPACGGKKFHLVEGCPQCDTCGSQVCSI